MAFFKIFKKWRVILLITFLIFSLIAIRPQILGKEGVLIQGVESNSSASNAGIENPSSKLSLLERERVLSVERTKVNSVEEFYSVLDQNKDKDTLRVETSKGFYTLLLKNENNTFPVGLKVKEVPFSNLKKGLDLEGGVRVLLKPTEKISQEDLDTTIESLKERLNVYGLSDIVVRSASDLSGDDFILIEIAGASEEEVKELLAKQGKFEATIGNSTVFYGGKKDITYVCRSAECSGIDPRRGCAASSEGMACSFFFSITLSPEAAQRQADLTRNLKIVNENGENYLDQDIVLYLDDREVDRLKIGAELKGRETTQIQISGVGQGRTQAEAMSNSLLEMKKLQTIIITGSLPVKLDIVKFDNISPTLGKEFVGNVFFVGLLAMASVMTVVFLRYRKWKIIIPIGLTLASEITLILGFAALIGWNLDLVAIAGIIIVIGTGVDHLIVITDETLKGNENYDWKSKLKNAMIIIFGAYFTNLAGMLPLLWAGAGLLKGFALTTIAGISFGVLIARPAFASIIEELLKD